jgi:rhamnosyltransferase
MCQLAFDDGFEWILTLDQDSICPPNIINSFIPYTKNPDVGIVCPRFFIRGNDDSSKQSLEIPSISVDFCITSASLTKLSIWEELEGFNEWLFIDCVDYEYCIKLRKANYIIIRVNTVAIDHMVGAPSYIYFPFGRKKMLLNHTPKRNYYIVRNNIYLIRKYHKELKGMNWLLKLIYIELQKLLFEKNRKQTFLALVSGVKDGLASKI